MTSVQFGVGHSSQCCRISPPELDIVVDGRGCFSKPLSFVALNLNVAGPETHTLHVQDIHQLQTDSKSLPNSFWLFQNFEAPDLCRLFHHWAEGDCHIDNVEE